MKHIALLGDSVFDNAAYVGREPDVVSHLAGIMPDSLKATLCAVDGALVQHVAGQLRNVPESATHLIISAGGNNALMNVDVLQLPVASSAEALAMLAQRTREFERSYISMLGAILAQGLPRAVSTIYFPNFPDRRLQEIAVTALSSFNDVIIRCAVSDGLPILDLRLICNEADDYANEIEPSCKGGRKIAAAIVKLVEQHDFKSRRTSIYF